MTTAALLLIIFSLFTVRSEGGSLVTYLSAGTNAVATNLVSALLSYDDFGSASANVGLSASIQASQNQGGKVFLSLNVDGNMINSLSLISHGDAQQVSDYIWNNFLGGHSNSRPFGDDVVFDGINFQITDQSSSDHIFLGDLSTSLKQKNVYLSASVPCGLLPDQLAGSFDSIWVRFYNNHQCEYTPNNNADALLAAWNRWTTTHASSSTDDQKIFLGLPAAPGAARSGYIPPQLLTTSVLPTIKTSPKYGGVVLWDSFYDQQTGYTAAIIHSV